MPLKPLIFFLFKSVVIYAVLMIPWPGVYDAYRAVFRTVGNELFGSMHGGSAAVRFEPYTGNELHMDTGVVLQRRNPPLRGRTELPAVLIGYRPTAFLVALTLATPIPWSRRMRALLAGLVAVSLFVVFRVWLRLVDVLSESNPLAVYQLGAFWKGVLHAATTILFRMPVPTYIVPAFIWLAVSFRRGDFERTLIPEKNVVGKPSRATSAPKRVAADR